MVYSLVRRYSTISLIAAPLFYLQFTLYSFVQTDNGQKIATLGFVLGNAVDVALNFILVVWLKKGIDGAAAATVAGRVVSISVYLAHILGKGTLKFRRSAFRWKEVFSSFSVGNTRASPSARKTLFTLSLP